MGCYKAERYTCTCSLMFLGHTMSIWKFITKQTNKVFIQRLILGIYIVNLQEIYRKKEIYNGALKVVRNVLYFCINMTQHTIPPPFLHNLSDCEFVESKLFEDGFVTFSKLMSNNNSFSEILRNCCFCCDTLPQMCVYHEDQTLIDLCSLTKSGWSRTQDCWPNDWKQMDSNLAFILIANPRGSYHVQVAHFHE